MPMSYDYRDIYLFMLEDVITYGIFFENNAVEWFKKYRLSKGKFWCWHRWTQFRFPDGTTTKRINGDAICKKCGKIDHILLYFDNIFGKFSGWPDR